MTFRKTLVSALVAIATFGIGLSSYDLLRVSWPVFSLPSAAAQREDNLHRIYEAAMMSGDSAIRDDVMGRFLCMGADESLQNRLVEQGENSFCLGPNRERYSQWRFRHDFKSGLRTITDTHGKWSVENIAFISQISTPQSARAYVMNHLP